MSQVLPLNKEASFSQPPVFLAIKAPLTSIEAAIQAPISTDDSVTCSEQAGKGTGQSWRQHVRAQIPQHRQAMQTCCVALDKLDLADSRHDSTAPLLGFHGRAQEAGNAPEAVLDQ